MIRNVANRSLFSWLQEESVLSAVEQQKAMATIQIEVHPQYIVFDTNCFIGYERGKTILWLTANHPAGFSAWHPAQYACFLYRS